MANNKKYERLYKCIKEALEFIGDEEDETKVKEKLLDAVTILDDKNKVEEKNKALYGESRNFGVIYSVIEGNTSNLNENKSKRKAYKDIITAIKENKVLKNQFMVYEALSKTDGIKDPASYVTEAITLIPGMPKKQIVETNTRLIEKIRKYNLYEMVDIPDDKMSLYESIEYLLLNKKNYGNLSEYNNAKSNIVEYITKHSVEGDNNVNESYGDKAVELMDKYSNELNEDEINLLKTLSECEDKEGYFNDCRESVIRNLTNVNSTLNGENHTDVNTIIESIKNKKFNPLTFVSDIAEMKEIGDVIQH